MKLLPALVSLLATSAVPVLASDEYVVSVTLLGENDAVVFSGNIGTPGRCHTVPLFHYYRINRVGSHMKNAKLFYSLEDNCPNWDYGSGLLGQAKLGCTIFISGPGWKGFGVTAG